MVGSGSTNKTCSATIMEQLYCTHCGKTFRVKADDIRRMRAHGQKVHKPSPDTYRFEDGCFFKALALLKRQNTDHGTTSRCLND
jgi:hypothetical protein